MKDDDRHGIHRRQMLTETALAVAGLGAASLLTSVSSASAAESTAAAAKTDSSLKVGAKILFQGDSITDAGRNRKHEVANHGAGLGRGYPAMLAGMLLGSHPDKKLEIQNRGISGHKVPDLAKRWQQDTIDLQPDVLSILIGVNDIWHKMNGNYDGTVADYEKGYRELLLRTITLLPGVRIIVCEPFALRTGAVKDSWYPEFDERRAVAKRLADENKLTFVPFQQMFDSATKSAAMEFWAGDGVHPTTAGHALMAATWRQVVGI